MSDARSKTSGFDGRGLSAWLSRLRRARRPLVVLSLLLGAASSASAQTSFLEVTPAADPYFVTPPEEDFWVNAVAPADVDGDGDLDLAVIGFYVVYNVSAEDRLVLFINDGPDPGGVWLFSHQLLPLGSLSAGASDLAWADFDGDADYDLAVGSDGATVVYRNDAGVLTQLDGVLPGYWEDSSYTGAYDLRSLTWADADNDGDQDLLIPSVFDPDTSSMRTVLMRNEGASGGSWLFTDTSATIDPTVHAQSAWADDDADGDLDLFLVNVDPYLETGFVRRYGNDGGTFTGSDLLAIRVEYGLADWGDHDGDGDLDILVAGNIQEAGGTYDTVLRIYRNDGGSYTETSLINAPNADWLDLHAATWADYDSDGDVDLLITGNFVGAVDIEGKSDIWSNDGGAFSALGVNLPAPISSIGRGGTFTWLDLDGDGDLDYLVAGAYYVPGGNGLVEARMHLYRNEAGTENLAPTVPTGLTAVPGDGGVVALSWSPADDDSTPPESITYDLDLRLVGGSALSAERPPEPGDVSAVTSWALTGLAPGSYVWSVRAVDSAFNGGSAAEGTFAVAGDALFGDGFESGDTSAWTASVP
ncbi:MAG TPA: FG-GAP-like repeat-containing protein [Thermoanaerobaculales bacterium]|nr:FG-GAP-like repeat-containing protein [Thermoanaerobaculales bacterium]